MSPRRYCPQCGEPIRFGRIVDAEGFCARLTQHGLRQDLACREHILRFDAVTGERLGGVPQFESAWDNQGLGAAGFIDRLPSRRTQ